MRNYTVYVLRNPRNVLYKGYTSDLDKRIKEHNAGLSPWTKGRGPWNVVYTEKYLTRSEAVRREKFLKSGQGRQFLKNTLSSSESS